ncbi:MAG TPA: 30S ribosome-binding factor RbfA [Hanamia sp.]|jgi:ribosome-binding factor A|nr:30S ribosome-binding factor RbfA [Hanamia sp.]
MTEGKRQKQVAAEVSKELNEIFLKMGLTMLDGGMVSIASVKITPDLYEARIYLSFFQVKDQEAALEKFRELSGEIRGELGKRMRHQLRIIPQLTFYLDDTLDYVFKIEKLLDEIKNQDQGSKNSPDSQK